MANTGVVIIEFDIPDQVTFWDWQDVVEIVRSVLGHRIPEQRPRVTIGYDTFATDVGALIEKYAPRGLEMT